MNGAVVTLAILLAATSTIAFNAILAVKRLRKECYDLKCRMAAKRKIIDTLKRKYSTLSVEVCRYREFIFGSSTSFVASNHASFPYKVDVNVIDNEGRLKKTIKSFSYDPCDVEDEMFAIREANELIETIQKA